MNELDVTYTVGGKLSGDLNYINISTGLTTPTYTAQGADGLTITEGKEYEFVVWSHNKYGPSLASSAIATIVARTVPDICTTPVVTTSTIYSNINWTPAPSGRGDTITAYEIRI